MDGFLDDVFDMGLDERQAERRIFEMTNDRHESKLNKIGKNQIGMFNKQFNKY